MDTVLIKNGMIIDGSADCQAYRGDVFIKDGKISKVGGVITSNADLVIDADGKVVSPGFIDLHRHGDLSVFFDKFGTIELAQGITSTCFGLCGFSAAPFSEKSKGLYEYMEPTHGPAKDSIEFNSISDYITALRKTQPAINVTTFQGLGAIRVAVKGFGSEPWTDEEMSQGQQLVQAAIDGGVIGFSAGLVYVPEMFNTTEEIIRLLVPCKGKGLTYMPHMRNEAGKLVQAVEESIKIAKSCDMKLHISHFKALGKANWNKAINNAIEIIEKARSEGMDIKVDFYPYHGTATTMTGILPSSYLTLPLPELLKVINQPQWVEKLKYVFAHPSDNDEIIPANDRFDYSLISSVNLAENQKYLGKTIREATKLSPYDDEFEFICQLLHSENGMVGVIGLNINPDDIKTIIKLPYSMVISDSLYNNTDTPHPRLYGSFTRFITQYVLEEHLLSLPQAVHKMSYLPAQALHLTDRGMIKEGFAADILVFDPKNLKDNATFEHGKALSEGFEYILVNGKLAWHNEKRMGRFGESLI